MDFSINGLSLENRLRSQRTPTPWKLKVNDYKLIYLVIRIQLTRLILVPRFTIFFEKIRSSIFACFYIWKHVSWESWFRLQAVSKIHLPIYPYLISEGKRNCSTQWPAQQRNRDWQKTCYQIQKICENWWSKLSKN